MEKVKRQFSQRQLSLGKLAKKLSTRSHSESRLESDDSEHLLENCEPLDVRLSEKEKALLEAANSKTTSNGTPHDKDSSSDSIDKHKIPSSLIVLTEDEKKRLEYVLLQIGLRDVGLA